MTQSLSEVLAEASYDANVSSATAEVVEKLLIDVAGLCVAARNADYVRAALNGWEAGGACTAIACVMGEPVSPPCATKRA